MAQPMRSGGSRRRRSMSEINMVPFIDVMLVLLIIFMVTAPLITTGVVDLPSVGAVEGAAHVGDRAGGRHRRAGEDQGRWPGRAAAGDAAADRCAREAGAARSQNTPVVISAERNVKYDAVVKVMDTLQKAGVQRVGLSVKQGA